MLGKRGIGNKPLLIGLTGDFGSGKSTVARFFKERGAYVLSADQLVHEVFRKENRLYPRICSLFPGLKGNVSRVRVARVVFQDPQKRRALERLIHPYVFNRIREEVKKASRPVIVLEVPLLFESGFHRHSDCNIVVKVERKKVLERLVQRGYRKSEIEARWRAQWPLEEKIKHADYLIDNSNGLHRTRREVVRVWEKIERSLSTHGKRKGGQ